MIVIIQSNVSSAFIQKTNALIARHKRKLKQQQKRFALQIDKLNAIGLISPYERDRILTV